METMRFLTLLVLILLFTPGVYASTVKRGPNWIDTEQPDGTHVAEVYTGPVNFLSNGTYVAIDSTIESDEEGYLVEKGIYNARWDKDSWVHIKKDDFYISYKEKDLKIGAKVNSIKKQFKKMEKNKLSYLVDSFVDIEYDYLPTVLKQTYILRYPFSGPDEDVNFNTVLQFSPKLELSVEGSIKESAFETNQSIDFKDGEHVVFRIRPPIIWDSNNESVISSYLGSRKGNQLNLTLIMPMEWLRNRSRRYPIFVDPTIEVEPSDDTFIWQANPNTNYDNWGEISAQTHLNNNIYGVLKFNLPSIPADKVFESTLELYHIYQSTGAENRIIEVHKVNSDAWNENSLTWSNYPGHSGTIIASTLSSIGTPGSYKTFLDLSLHDAVIEALNSDGVISLAVKDNVDNEPTYYKNSFWPHERGSSSERPKLVIKYSTKPNTPIPQGPYDGEIVTTLTPPFSWSPFSDPDGDTQDAFNIKVCREAAPNNPCDLTVLNKVYPWAASSYTPPQSDYTFLLENGRFYHWNVRVQDSEGAWSDWSADYMDFYVDLNNPPTASNNGFTPSTGDTTTIFTFYFTYTDVDNDPPSTGYPQISIDSGSWYAMSKTNPSDNTYTDGVQYEYKTTLSAGSHTYKFRYKDDYHSTQYYPTSGSFSGPTVSPAGGGGDNGTNTDGDDLTDWQENQMVPIYDAAGNRFPDPNVKDAYKPINASKIYYSKKYLGKNASDVVGKSLIEANTVPLGQVAFYLAKLYQVANNATIQNSIEQQLVPILDEIVDRQQQEYWPWNKKPHMGNVLNLEGYVRRNRSVTDLNKEFYYDNPTDYNGVVGLALLEGYKALQSTNPTKAEKYKQAGMNVTNFLIRWFETYGFDDEGNDTYNNGNYHSVAKVEKNQKGGDEFDSVANHYGMVALVVANVANIVGGSYYWNISEGDMLKKGITSSTYENIANWFAEEMRKLQRYTIDGGVRAGPLDPAKHPKDVRLHGMIEYSGMSAIGARQVRDLNNNLYAWDFTRDLAGHYWYLRKERGGWWARWDLDNNSIWVNRTTGDIDKSDDEKWGAVIELSGEYPLGFRQGMVDIGGFLCSASSLLNYVMYQGMKMESNPFIIFPVNESVSANCTPNRYKSNYSNPIIFLNETKTITTLVDPTVLRLTADVNLNSTSSNLQFKIFKPDGTEINSSNYNSFQGVNYTVNGTYKYYTVDNPENGIWTLQLKAISVPSNGEEYYMMSILGTTVGMEAETSMNWYIAGEEIEIVTTLQNTSETMSGQTITGKITKPDGKALNVQFYDNGQNGDYKDNDGRYTYILRDTSMPGFYAVEVTASGQISGVNYERRDTLSFEVVGAEEERKEAFFAGLIRNRDYHPGDTVSGFFYVGDEGNIAIDDEIHYTIKGPTGEWKYKKWEPIYLEPDEVLYKKFSWNIPQDAPSGLYHLKVEFDDPDIEGFPLSKWFWVSGLTIFGLPVEIRRKKGKKLLTLLFVLAVISQGCVQETEKRVNKTGANLTTPTETKKPLTTAPVESTTKVLNEVFKVNKNSATGHDFKDVPLSIGLSPISGYVSFFKTPGIYHESDKTDFKISTGTHYLKLKYRYTYVVIEKHSETEFEDWDLKIDIKDLNNSYSFNITYKEPAQNETKIQKLVEGFRDKKLMYLNTTSSSVNWMADVPGTGESQSSIIIKEGKVYIDGKEYFNQDVERIKNSILDTLLLLNYTNKGYERSNSFQIANIEIEETEAATMEFDDGSRLELTSYSLPTWYVIWGALEINSEDYFFSSESATIYSNIDPKLGIYGSVVSKAVAKNIS